MQHGRRWGRGLLRVTTVPLAAAGAAPSSLGTVRLSASVLALALLGDALLYVALPVDAARFGVSAAGVGLLLSVNRLVRIAGYGLIADAAQRFGPRALTLFAAIAASVSTLGYGILRGLPALLALRVAWGLAFGALSLTTIVYAVEEPGRAAHRLGASRALTALGPLVALSLGPLVAARWSTPVAFLALGTLTMLAIPMAAALPRRADAAPPARGETRTRWGFLARRSPLTWWSLGIGFAVDGAFAVSLALLVSRSLASGPAIAAAGLVLATRYATEVALAPLAGAVALRVGVRALLGSCTALVASGFAAMAIGAAGAPAFLWGGAVAVVIGRGLLLPLGPAALASDERDANAYRAQGDLAAWRDVGAAIGPLAAGVAVPAIAPSAWYAILALGVLAVVGAGWPASFPPRLRLPVRRVLRRRRPRPTPIPHRQESR